MEKPTFFARRAILVLIVVFFFVPFALRGARMAVQGMKNDVKDWLPKGFAETKDLDWFRKYFVSEQFVLVSWDGCHGDADDKRYQLFVAKLQPEIPPSVHRAAEDAAKAAAVESGATDSGDVAAAASVQAEPEITSPTKYLSRVEHIGDQLGLYIAGNQQHFNWGDLQEKWLRGRKLEHEGSNEEAWYYITPDGDLFRWEGVDSPFASLARVIYRALVDRRTEGKLVHAFGPIDGAWYHEDPRRLRAQLFSTMTTGPDVLNSLIRPGGELADDPDEAHRRLAGTLFGHDGKQTCIILTLTEAAKQNLHLVLGRGQLGKPRGLLYEIAQQTNIPEEELRMGGPAVDNVAIDEEGTVTLFRLAGMCALLGVSLAYICFRSVSATIIIFFIGGISAVMCLAFVWWFGSSADAILMSMPALVFVLGLSGAAHIINYYHEAVQEHGYVGAPERALAHGWKPALMCNVTTAIGLVSLYTSELIPIQKFGLFSAIGVMATLLILFTYLPAALQIWPQKPRKKAANQQADQQWMEKYLSGFWHSLGSFIIRNHAMVAIGCILIIAVTGWGVTYIHTSVNMLRMFHKDAKIIQDYEWLEANLGHLVPMEIVVTVPKAAQLPDSDALILENEQLARLTEQLDAATDEAQRKQITEQIAKIERRQGERFFQLPFLERMELAARVQQAVEDEFGPRERDIVGRATSAATFVRRLPDAQGDTRTRLVRNSTSGRLEAHRDEFLHSDYLRIEEGTQAELWRVSLRIGATKGVDYGKFVGELKDAVEPVLVAQRQRETILRQIVDDRDSHQVGGAKVLLLGVPVEAMAEPSDAIPPPVPEEPTSGCPLPTESELAAEGSYAPINQTKILARTLIDLLNVARLKVQSHVPEEQELPENFAEVLAAQDCVVLVGDHGSYDEAMVRKHARRVIDVRQPTWSQIATTAPTVSTVPATPAAATAIAAAPVSAVYTGVVPIVYKAQRSLLDSLIESTFWSFITITPLMMYLARSIDWTSSGTLAVSTVRSIGAGGVAMLPNVLPVLMVFGGMGWLDIDVDIGSMMTASIALGVAVDDTIHYLNWFREELDRLGDRKKAILAAYKHCATPTLQAAIIGGLGLSVFALSTFTPTERFGYLMLTILWMGVVAELIFFPALLAGPLGAFFVPRKKAGEAPATVSASLAETRPATIEEPRDVATGSVPAPNKPRSSIYQNMRQDGSHGRRRD